MSPAGEDPPGKKRPDFKVYRSRPKVSDRFRKPDLAGLRSERDKQRAGKAKGSGGRDRGDMRTYRAGGGRFDRFRREGGGSGNRRRWWKYALLAIAGWILISFIAFAISAQIQKGKLNDTGDVLSGGNNMLFGKGNVLVLGGDKRSSDPR